MPRKSSTTCSRSNNSAPATYSVGSLVDLDMDYAVCHFSNFPSLRRLASDKRQNEQIAASAVLRMEALEAAVAVDVIIERTHAAPTTASVHPTTAVVPEADANHQDTCKFLSHIREAAIPSLPVD